MIGLFTVFVTDNDLVVPSIVIGQMSYGQRTVGPVTTSLQERLILLVEIQGSEEGNIVLEPGGLMFWLIDQERLQDYTICLLSHAQLLGELWWSRKFLYCFCIKSLVNNGSFLSGALNAHFCFDPLLKLKSF